VHEFVAWFGLILANLVGGYEPPRVTAASDPHPEARRVGLSLNRVIIKRPMLRCSSALIMCIFSISRNTHGPMRTLMPS